MNTKSACLLLTLCHAGTAAALGLGELQVRSFLGQPLRASVALLGAPADLGAECFSVAPGNDRLGLPLRVQLSIERVDGKSQLVLRTQEAIQEPVAQFTVVSDCEARLQREYVALLDPPPASEIAPPTLAAPLPMPAPAPVPPSPGASRARARAAAVDSEPHGHRASASPKPRHHVSRPVAGTPRLVLSGQHAPAKEATFALKLDTRLPDVAASVPRPEVLTPTEISDENTALTHKLAHLETQLAALRERNATLDREAAAARPVAPPPSVDEARWPLYLLMLTFVAAVVGVVVWLSRRARESRTLQFDDSTWTLLKDATPIESTDDFVPPVPERMAEVPRPAQDDGTEVKEDILDQAEVFMAHGHANLAIHLLQEHVRAAPTESPVPWLLLLDLLHREGDSEGYAAASTECRRYFNVNVNEHPVSQDGDSSQGIEAYPHLLDRLVEVWRSPERDAFFQDLIYDHRGGTRMGFQPAAYRDILLLRAIAQTTAEVAA